MTPLLGTILCGICVGICLLPWAIETIKDWRN